MSLYSGLNEFIAPIAPILRGTISFISATTLPIDYLLTRDAIMARPAFNVSGDYEQPRTLSLAPNKQGRSSAKESKKGE